MSYLDYVIIFSMMAIMLSLDYIMVDRRIYLLSYFIAFITLSMFSGLRTEGPDIDYYRDIYVNCDQYLREADSIFSTHIYKVETGYFFAGYLLYHIGLDYFSFQLIVCTCSLAIVFWFGWVATDRPGMFVFLYYCFLFVIKFHAQTRNAIALSIFLIAYYFLVCRKKYIYGVTALCLSLLFHTSLAVNYILILLGEISRKKSAVILLGSLVFAALIVTVFPDIDRVVIEKAAFYYNWDYDFRLGPSGNIRVVLIAILAGLCLLPKFRINEIRRSWMLAAVFAVIQYGIFYSLPDIAVRILDNLMPLIILMYMAFDRAAFKDRKMISFLMILFIGIIFNIGAIRLVWIEEIKLLNII